MFRDVLEGGGDFNPRSPCGERLGYDKQLQIGKIISIRAPLAGNDMNKACGVYFYKEFQSALPLRGTTSALNAFS